MLPSSPVLCVRPPLRRLESGVLFSAHRMTASAGADRSCPFTTRRAADKCELRRSEFDAGYHCYVVVRGVEKERSIALLQRFYNRENEKAPDEKRRRKACPVC